MPKTYIVVDSDNHWLSTFTAESEEQAEQFFQDTLKELRAGDYNYMTDGNFPETVYLYEAKEIKSVSLNEDGEEE